MANQLMILVSAFPSNWSSHGVLYILGGRSYDLLFVFYPTEIVFLSGYYRPTSHPKVISL